eukprot:6085315-Pleurochrysis_carterae.AAC.1
MAVAFTRKGKVGRIGFGGKRAVGLIEDLRLCVNQHRSDADLRNLSAADAENRLLLRWDSFPFTDSIFEPISSGQHTTAGAADFCSSTSA